MLLDHCYWWGPNYRKEFAVYRLFCNQNKEKHRKNIRRFKVKSSYIRQYTFCLEIQSINWGNPVFFDPSFCYIFCSHRTLLSEVVFHSIIGSSVSMSVKHKPLHWYCTSLSENPSFSYNSPLVNQKPVCYFKSKYPVNMTDEEWLQVLEKKFKFWSSLLLPPYVHMVGEGRMHICYCEMFIIGRNLTIFPVWL